MYVLQFIPSTQDFSFIEMATYDTLNDSEHSVEGEGDREPLQPEEHGHPELSGRNIGYVGYLCGNMF